MTAVHFTLSAASIGLANILIEWLIIGFLFHKSQALTPDTWKKESSGSYLYSIFLAVLFGALFTLFYMKIGSKYVIARNLWSHIKLGLICFAAFSFVTEINNFIYINYKSKFAIGKMIASCLSIVAAAIIASHFYWR
ncbi:hypothetical protein [uncultured Mucilaginibacter sp.]|uniref:hypothetical protein n=1 Tax=uncultured Mucilaginibacter sp. TaxID=797541 RepID=UPI0025FD5F19|nr:hypothetical protein [uncultured Mucilaginibacter sp.]